MEYVRLGKTGLQVSRLCLGMMSYGDPNWGNGKWVKGEEESLALMKLAWDAGINFWDTANVYGNGASERLVGKAIKTFNIPRSRLVVATKCYFPVLDGSDDMLKVSRNDPRLVNNMGLSRKHIFDAVHASLERLDCGYIDILYIHRFDPNTPIEETMEALNDLVRSGKVRYLGASSMYAWQFARMNDLAERKGWAKFVVMQNYHNALYREEEREMIPYLQDQGIAMAPWSPLAQGILARPLDEKSPRSSDDFIVNYLFGAGFTDADKAIADRVGEVAAKHGVSRAQVAIAWSLSKPYMTSPIVGISKKQYLDDAVAALSLNLTLEEVQFIDEPYQPKKVVGRI
ncbi:Aldo/keto reductase [Hesseltinella vesiculosa]|uniref:Aldo/keto reductase n=1 Tax=Hesseltinella vesiculosa TaxID=101127 RepID=A0A1X2GI59_9FUNG|nr:Aldo/keto reductase [Hesseltinella vesiculosa]